MVNGRERRSPALRRGSSLSVFVLDDAWSISICGTAAGVATAEASDARCLAGLAQALQFFSTAALAGLFVISLTAHLLAKSTAFAEFSESTNSILNRLTGTNP
jgi:hypothetical protein